MRKLALQDKNTLLALWSENLYNWPTLNKLVNHFDPLHSIFKTPIEQIQALIPRSKKTIQVIRNTTCESAEHKAETVKARARQTGTLLLCPGDSLYPKLLTEIDNPPLVLSFSGDVGVLNTPSVALVGTRNLDDYGKYAADYFAFCLAKQGITIISGGALGIDTRCHERALAGGGKTIAVLGAGLDHPGPASNLRLFRRIKDNGGLISEFPFSVVAYRGSFPVRNRTIAGMSRGTVVIEAPARSGALITASRTREMGRPVFSVPGEIRNSTCEGSNLLLKNGAIPVMNARDVLEVIGQRDFFDRTRTSGRISEKTDTGGNTKVPLQGSLFSIKEKEVPDFSNKGLTSAHKSVFLAIRSGVNTGDELSVNLGMTVSSLAQLLLELELEGLIAKQPGNTFTIVS